MVQEKDGEDQLDRSCEQRRSVTCCQSGENILHTINRRKGNWIGHNLRRNCLLRHVVEGKVEGREEEEVSSYCITVSKREHARN